MRRGFFIAFLLFGPRPAARAAEAPAHEKAMKAELKRAASELKQEGYPGPYYVSLTASDVESWQRRCLMGAVSFSSGYRQRLFTPDVRVGSHELDNHPVSPSEAFVARAASQDDDEFALRHSLWRLLDESYKGASAGFLRKQALRVRRGKTEYDTDDLSRETARVHEAEQGPSPWDSETLTRLCRKASAVFRGSPGLLNAEAEVKTERLWSRLRDSEGSRVDFGRDTVEIELDAVDISTDGLRLFASRRFVAVAGDPLPREGELESAARDMLADLKALKSAQSTSPFSAPALIDPSVSAAVVLAIGMRLTSEELRDLNGAQTFRDKMGKSVLPSDFSLVDDPTLKSYGGVPLSGRYEYDDQGVPGRKTALIEAGALKGLLLSRYPAIGFPHSNGHARTIPGYPPEGVPGNLILSSDRPASPEELLSLLRAECAKRGKPYGLWIKKLRGFSQQQGASNQGAIRLLPGLAYLVDAKTGAMTLVRDLDVVGTPLDLMSNIIRAGDDPTVHNMSMGLPLSVVVPTLLLRDAELQRAETKPEKPPILPPPARP